MMLLKPGIKSDTDLAQAHSDAVDELKALAKVYLAERTNGHTPIPANVSRRLAATMGVSDKTLVEIGLPPLTPVS